MASLLPKQTTTTTDQPPSLPLSYHSPTLLTLFATTRLAFGTISLLAPSPTLHLFQILTPTITGTGITTASTAPLLPTRMFGIRDAVLGALLYTAETPAAARRALIAGAVVDAVDVLSCLYGFLGGELGGWGAGLVGGGAVVFLVWGVGGLRVLERWGGGAGGAGGAGKGGKGKSYGGVGAVREN